MLILLKSRTGINFNYYRDNFVETRIKYRIFNLKIPDVKSYLNYIRKNPGEIDKFLKKFTINTSFFFRDRDVFETLGLLICESLGYNQSYFQFKTIMKDDQFKKLSSTEIPKEELIRMLQHLSLYKKIKNQKNPVLYIWSCPCASGQEPYSIAMLFDTLEEIIPNFPGYKIVASDIDKHVLEHAKRGIYFIDVLKEVPEYFKTKYFTKIEQPIIPAYQICDKIKKKVEFVQQDIIQEQNEKGYKYDIILCRYLLIYIQKEYQEIILRNLQNHLARGGLMILGNTESLLHLRINLQSLRQKIPFYTEIQK